MTAKVHVLLLVVGLLASNCSSPVIAGEHAATATTITLKFAVMALVTDPASRVALEDAIVTQLQQAQFKGAAVSHTYVQYTGSAVSRKRLVQQIDQLELHGVLVVRPLAVGSTAKPIALASLPAATADTVEAFLAQVEATADWSVAVQVGAFLLSSDEPQLFWRGVAWIEQDHQRPVEALAQVISAQAVAARQQFRQAALDDHH